jgi:hypothetical protein
LGEYSTRRSSGAYQGRGIGGLCGAYARSERSAAERRHKAAIGDVVVESFSMGDRIDARRIVHE